MPEHMICVAAIAGAFGVHGDVRLKSFTADPSALEAYAPLVTQDNAQSFTVHLTGRTAATGQHPLPGTLGETVHEIEAAGGRAIGVPAVPTDKT